MMSDVFRRARRQQVVSMRAYKKHYDRRHQAKEVSLIPGYQILCKNFCARTKMDDPWLGPFVVVAPVGRRHLDYIDSKGVIRRTHVRNTKCVHVRDVW